MHAAVDSHSRLTTYGQQDGNQLAVQINKYCPESAVLTKISIDEISLIRCVVRARFPRGRELGLVLVVQRRGNAHKCDISSSTDEV